MIGSIGEELAKLSLCPQCTGCGHSKPKTEFYTTQTIHLKANGGVANSAGSLTQPCRQCTSERAKLKRKERNANKNRAS